MPFYLLVDGANAILEAYTGPADGAPAGAVEIPAALYAQLPPVLGGCTFVPAAGDSAASVTLPASPPPPPAAIPYVPNWLVRQRLQTAGLWDQAVTAMSPAQQLEFATLQDGIDPSDATVIALLNEIGARPADILGAQG